jgi:hypothetical protein
MRSMQRQLGKAGTISAFALGPRETKKKKTCVEMAGRRTFRILTYSQLYVIKVKAVFRPKYNNLYIVMIQCTHYKNCYTFKTSNDNTHNTKQYTQIQLKLQLVIKIFYIRLF